MALTQETRQIEGIRGVNLAGVGEVVIRQGAREVLVVTAEETVLPYIKTEVTDSILYLRIPLRPLLSFEFKRIKYELTVKTIDTLQLSGAGQMTATLQVDTLTATISGAGAMIVTGKAPRQVVTLSGAGSYQADDLASQDVKVTVSGTGSATVWAQESLEALVSGLGSITYYGDPVVTRKISGLGSIDHKAR